MSKIGSFDVNLINLTLEKMCYQIEQITEHHDS